MRPFKDLQKTEAKAAKEVRVTLSQDEIRQRGELLAETSYEQAILETEKKESAKRFADEIKELRSKCATFRDAVRNGVEMRQVPCSWYIDWGLGRRYLVRDDTQECVEESNVPDAWRQGRIEGDPYLDEE